MYIFQFSHTYNNHGERQKERKAYLTSTVRPAVRLDGFCFPKKTKQKPTVEGAQHQFGFLSGPNCFTMEKRFTKTNFRILKLYFVLLCVCVNEYQVDK